MKTDTQGEIDADEIQHAIKTWLRREKGIEVSGPIRFRTQEVYDDTDWQGRYGPIGTDVTAAYFTVKEKP